MKIGIISDTHNYLNPRIVQYLQGVDLILHAGDIGSQEIMDRLALVAPVTAIRGNIDYKGTVSMLPEQIITTLGNVTFLMIHDIGNINSFCEKLNQGEFHPLPEVIVYGHTHQAFYKNINGFIFLNPGSATNSRDHRKPSLSILELQGSEIISNRLIEI